MNLTKLNDRQTLAAARGLALKRAPYFASAMYAMVFIPVEGMMETHGAAIGVTKKLICHYDPRVVTEEGSLDDGAFGPPHEARVRRGSGKRPGFRPRERRARRRDDSAPGCSQR